MKVEKKNINDILPLTSIQKSMLFTYLYEPDANLYMEQINIIIDQKLDFDAFKIAWQTVVDSNEVLRSIFVWEKLKEPVQIILNHKNIPIRSIDLSACNYEEKEQKIQDEKNQYFKKKIINLNKNPIQLSLIKMEQESYLMSINYHHILLDGWSLGIILQEFSSVYRNIINKTNPQIARKTAYKEYLKWRPDPNIDAESYWKNYLLDNEYVGLPYIGKLNHSTNIECSTSIEFSLSSEIQKKFENYIEHHHVTAASLIYSVWAVLMQRYCLSDKIIFGTTVSGRIPEIQGMENMVGMFINTLPMCIALDGVSTVELVKTVHQQLISRKEYEYMPYTEIQEISNKNGDVPLFHTIVAIENYPLPEGNNHFLSVESIHETTNYMLALEAMFSDKLAFKIIYRNSIPRHEVSALASRFKNILEAFLVDDNKRIDQIKIISEKERKEIIEIGTQQTDYPFDKTINDLFKEQVLRYPHKTALITDKVSLTYNQLDEMASKLACHMMATGVQKESIIGIVTERSHETIVSILAAIKTGCTYLPIDPHYPLDRVKNILHDSNAHILILPDCSEFNSNELSFPNIIRYDSLTFNCDSDVKSFWDISPNNAAYVMYTSGSTGSPKGVVVEHKSVVRLVKNSLTFPMNENGKILQTGSIAFDAATFEIWGALLNGQCLIIRNKLLALDAVMLSREVAEQQITTLWLTSPLFDQISDKFTDDFAYLKTLIIGGDKLTPEKVNSFRRKFPGICVVNGYGPTENTTFTTAFYIDDEYEKSVPIGRPISNSSVFVFDHHMNLQGKNLPGELYAGGDGLARGYLNNPMLTSEKMIQSPIDNQKLYKTGDYVRWNEKGNLEFLGRKDEQVKIRGHRIELAELQTALYNNGLVEKAVATISKDEKGIKHIIAFVIAKLGGDVKLNNIKSVIYQDIRGKLPNYLLPSEIRIVDKFPLNVNGKIDFNQLLKEQTLVKNTVENQDPLLKELSELWKQTIPGLYIDIKSDQDYFTIGGNSLTAITLSSCLSNYFNMKISVADVFTYRTLRDQADWLVKQLPHSRISKEDKKNEMEKIRDLVPKDVSYFELSVIQKRMWFLSQVEADIIYNVPIQFELYRDLDIGTAKQAVNMIIKRHTVLRTTFVEKQGETKQIIHENNDISLEYHDLSGMESQQQETEMEKLVRSELMKPFDYNNQPLIRGMVIRMGSKRNVLYFTTSHLIFDGWSIGVFIKEFLMIYRSLEKNEVCRLPQLDFNYIHYVYWQKQILEDGTMSQSKSYWMNQLSDIVSKRDGISDITSKFMNKDQKGQVISFQLPHPLMVKLERLAEKQNATMHMVLLSCYYMLVHKLTYENDIVIGMPTAGRNNSLWDPLIGCFINTLPIRLQMKSSMTLKQILEMVQDLCLQAYRYDYPYDLLLHEIYKSHGKSVSLFHTMFQYHNIQSLISDPQVRLLVKDYTLVSSKFDYKLDMYQQAGQIFGRFEFNMDLLDMKQCREITEEFITICELMANCSDKQVERIFNTKERILFDEDFGIAPI